MEWLFVHDLEAKARIETLRAFIEILHLLNPSRRC